LDDATQAFDATILKNSRDGSGRVTAVFLEAVSGVSRNRNVKVTRSIREVNTYFHRFLKKVYRNTEMVPISKTMGVAAAPLLAGRRFASMKDGSRRIRARMSLLGL
jgi:hypothetical protein